MCPASRKETQDSLQTHVLRKEPGSESEQGDTGSSDGSVLPKGKVLMNKERPLSAGENSRMSCSVSISPLHRVREMAWLVKRLPLKHEDLSSHPQDPHANQVSGSVRDPVSNNKVENN